MAMATNGVQFKAFRVVQGGADTAAETEILTGILPGVDFSAWRVLAYEFNLPPDVVKSWAAADSDLTVQITKRSLTGAIARIETYADQDLVTSFNMAMVAQGTSANWREVITTFLVELPVPLLLYSDSLFVQLISTATGQTNEVWGRVIYEVATITKDTAFAILASRA